MTEHLHFITGAVVDQRVGPGLLTLGQKMDVGGEGEFINVSLIEASLGREHVVVLPGIGAGAERGTVGFGVVAEKIRLHEHRVRVHVDIVRERERAELGEIRPFDTLDDLAVLVTQGSSATENRDTVLRVVVQIPCPERVAVLVPKLHQRASELREVLVDQVIQTLAAEHRAVLDDLDIAEGVDHIRVDVPQGGVTDQQGRVVLKTRVPQGLAVLDTIFINLLQLITAEQPHKTVLPLRGLGGKAEREQQKE